MRTSCIKYAGILQSLSKGKENFFTSLWNKPVTRDDRIKEYIPEVIEESLMEERAVSLENNARDGIVELGHKILTEIDRKSPTSRIAPYMTALLREYNSSELITQRPLSHLIYPTSSILSNVDTQHELVMNFSENFRLLIEEVEQSGCSVRSAEAEASLPDGTTAEASADGLSSAASDEGTLEEDSYEPLDITLFVRVTAGMALANVNCGDYRNALKCVDVCLTHARSAERIGGLHGLKAGILVRLKSYEEAVKASAKAISASQNIQGYLHGSYALHQLNRRSEEAALLEEGREAHPMNQAIEKRLSDTKKDKAEALPQLPASDTNH